MKNLTRPPTHRKSGIEKGEKPMLNFIIGRSCCGKTTYTHKLLGSLAKKGESAVLLVPKQFTFESDKGVLNALGPRLASNVEVLSFTRLADVVFKTCRGIGKPILKDTASAVMMTLALGELEEKLSFFARHKNSIAFVKKMLFQVNLLKKEAVTASQLYEAAEKLPQGLLKKKTYETALIFDTYDSLLKKSFFDDRDLLSAVYEILTESDFFDGKVVAIDDFKTFSGQEMKIIELIMKKAKDVYVTLCTDDIFSADPLSPFACVNKTAKRLMKSANRNGVEIGETTLLTDEKNGFATYLSPQLAFLEKNLFNVLATPFSGECDAVSVVNAPSLREECAFVASKVHKLLRSGEYRCRDIAVVYRSGESYPKEIRYSLKKYGVPIFEDRRASVQNEPLCVLVRSLFEIIANGVSLESVLKYAKTGLSALSWDEISEIENYALLWSLDSAALCREWKDNPDGFGIELTEERKETLVLLNQTKNRLLEPILALRERVKEKSAVDFLGTVFNFLVDEGVNERLKEYAVSLESSGEIELALEQEQIWNIITEIFDDLAAVLGERTVKPKKLLEFFETALETQSLGKLPDGYDEVYICDAARIQTKTAKVIFVVGANEGVFPLPVKNEGIFSDAESEKLRELVLDFSKSPIDASAEERFMIYNSLCSARERLFVSYSLTDQTGKKTPKSEIVTALEKLFSSLCETAYPFENELEMLESEEAAFEFMAENWQNDTETEKTLKKYFSKKEQYKGKLKAIERANDKKDFAFENAENAKNLFGKKLSLSASQLETYGNCPFQYFCRYGMKAKERKVASLDAANIGTVVHVVLERLLSNHSKEKIHMLDEATAQKEIKLYLKEYMEKFLGSPEDRTERFLYLYGRLFKTLSIIAKRLLAEFGESDFEPFDFELPITEKEGVRPLRISLSDGFVELHGIVDRVDVMKKNGKTYLRVVDYKTGPKEFSLSDVFSGLGMQMVLYLVSIWKNGTEKYGEVVPSGVLYLPARIEPFSAKRGEDEKKTEEKALSGGKMNGMILDDGEVIKGMDNSLSGRFVPIKANKKSGALCGNFISLSQLEALSKRLEKIMKDMGENLHGGKIPARPAYGKGHAQTCEWCAFSSVCQRQSGAKVRYIEKLTHGECLDILDGKGEKQ